VRLGLFVLYQRQQIEQPSPGIVVSGRVSLVQLDKIRRFKLITEPLCGPTDRQGYVLRQQGVDRSASACLAAAAVS
jgi:hypothetical protein